MTAFELRQRLLELRDGIEYEAGEAQCLDCENLAWGLEQIARKITQLENDVVLEGVKP